jgi:catechol 2,3-dioxygenase-like lactoylglutathione lyase family enzyme
MRHLRITGVLLIAAFGIQAGEPDAASNAVMPPAKALTMLSATFPSSDLKRSIAFYEDGLGLVAGKWIEHPDVTEVPFTFPGGGTYLILLQSKKESSLTASRSPMIALAVPDLKALGSRLAAAGYTVGGISQQPAYHLLVSMATDPDGNRIELLQAAP